MSAKTPSGSNCPQLKLPASCQSNPAMRRMFSVAFSVIGLVLLFVGSIMMLVGGIGVYEVPAEDFCKVLGYKGHPDCSSKDQDYDTTCCLSKNRPAANEMETTSMWAMPNLQSFATVYFSARDQYEQAKTYFTNYKDTNGKPMGYGIDFSGDYTAEQDAIVSDAKKLSQAFTFFTKAPQRRTFDNFDNQPCVIAGAFSMTFCFFALLNLTCFSRKGFAHYNLAFGAGLLALIVLGMRQAITAIFTSATDFKGTYCSSFDQSLFDYNNNNFQPTQRSIGMLLGKYACIDYQCKIDQGNVVCNKSFNPVVAWPLGMFELVYRGGIVSICGLVLLAGMMSNIGDMVAMDEDFVDNN